MFLLVEKHITDPSGRQFLPGDFYCQTVHLLITTTWSSTKDLITDYSTHSLGISLDAHKYSTGVWKGFVRSLGCFWCRGTKFCRGGNAWPCLPLPGLTVLLPSPPSLPSPGEQPSFCCSLTELCWDDFKTSLLNVKALSPAEHVAW